MDFLIVLVPVVACAAMMFGCAAMMWGGHRVLNRKRVDNDAVPDTEPRVEQTPRTSGASELTHKTP